MHGYAVEVEHRRQLKNPNQHQSLTREHVRSQTAYDELRRAAEQDLFCFHRALNAVAGRTYRAQAPANVFLDRLRMTMTSVFASSMTRGREPRNNIFEIKVTERPTRIRIHLDLTPRQVDGNGDGNWL